MEGVGARLGRSSSRYAPAPTVFNGPVRKWKKRWVPVVTSSSANNNGSSYNPNSQTANHNGTVANGNNGSHLLLYKWTPNTQTQNNDNNKNSNADPSSTKDAATGSTPAEEEPPRRKFKYIPIAVLEEQKNEALENEAAEKVVNEAKASDTDSNTALPNSRSDGLAEKPDINDLPMEESQALDDNPLARQDLNESTLDLSLA